MVRGRKEAGSPIRPCREGQLRESASASQVEEINLTGTGARGDVLGVRGAGLPGEGAGEAGQHFAPCLAQHKEVPLNRTGGQRVLPWSPGQGPESVLSILRGSQAAARRHVPYTHT